MKTALLGIQMIHVYTRWVVVLVQSHAPINLNKSEKKIDITAGYSAVLVIGYPASQTLWAGYLNKVKFR